MIVAAVLWELLQLAGGFYVNHVIRHATNTYGLFATVIGLLAWLHLGAQATLYAAEINVVLTRRLWPRSLFSPAITGDERTLEAIAKVEERSPAEKIDVLRALIRANWTGAVRWLRHRRASPASSSPRRGSSPSLTDRRAGSRARLRAASRRGCQARTGRS